MKYNINKLFPFLSIRTKLIVAFSLLSFIPLLVVGGIGIYYTLNTMEGYALHNLEQNVGTITERAEKFLEGIRQDLEYLTFSPVFREYLEKAHSAPPADIRRAKKRLMQQLLAFAKTKQTYYQLHFVDNTKTEHFNLQYYDSAYRIVPDSLVGNSRFYFYFLLADSLRPGELAVAPAEHLDLAGQRVAAISFVTPVADSEGTGLFLADIFAARLFKVLEDASVPEKNRRIAIVSSEGHYLYHSQKKRDWNRLLATRETETLFDEYGPDFARQILSGKRGIISRHSEELLAYAPLFSARFPGGNDYFLFEVVEKGYIFASVRRFAILFIPLLLFFLLLSVGFGYLATNQLTGPVKKLQRGAQIISRGNYTFRLEIDTNDEIEELAHQFNKMAEAIHERELMLDQHRRELEAMVRQRTRELQKERDKLQAILDNVPSAFILIDENNRILSASAAIERITRMAPQEVAGKFCYEIYWKDGLCDFCPRNSGRRQRQMEPFIRHIFTPDGEELYIEHLTIPFSMNDGKNVTLEILTNVTERKKLDNHLLKIEKLIATGEMSAVIAHEMRNSLTSVKMILQLQRENSGRKPDVQAIDVAIDSIHRMEEVLNSLLRFARPSPFALRQTNLNTLIEESLLFIQPRLNQAHLSLQLKMDEKIPPLNLDAEHLKEALYNILINAVQAVDGEGKIVVTTRLVTLSRRLEDFAFTDHSTLSNGKAQHKIVLEKGRRVVQVQIRDNGRGIDRKLLENIFDPFFTTKLSGTGLGLAITRQVVNQHGGIIVVTSKVKQGTTVNLYFPVKEEV